MRLPLPQVGCKAKQRKCQRNSKYKKCPAKRAVTGESKYKIDQIPNEKGNGCNQKRTDESAKQDEKESMLNPPKQSG